MSTLIVHPTPDKLEGLTAFLKALKIDFEKRDEEYDPEFVAKIKRGDEAHLRGDYTAIKVEYLWK